MPLEGEKTTPSFGQIETYRIVMLMTGPSFLFSDPLYITTFPPVPSVPPSLGLRGIKRGGCEIKTNAIYQMLRECPVTVCCHKAGEPNRHSSVFAGHDAAVSSKNKKKLRKNVNRKTKIRIMYASSKRKCKYKKHHA